MPKYNVIFPGRHGHVSYNLQDEVALYQLLDKFVEQDYQEMLITKEASGNAKKESENPN